MTLFQCDASDTIQMHEILKENPPLIFIDDGSHQYSHQIATFESVFPFLKNGRLYVCEDIQTSFGGYRKQYFNDQSLMLQHIFQSVIVERKRRK